MVFMRAGAELLEPFQANKTQMVIEIEAYSS